MAYKARKRKVKKNVPNGEVHVHSTFNNTVVTISTTHANTKLATQYIFLPLLIINPVSLVICP